MGKNRDEDFKRVLLPVTALEVNKGQIDGGAKAQGKNARANTSD